MDAIFHYTQCIFRQIQQVGLQQEYTKNEIVRGLCKKMMTLAMMPSDKVLASYNEIRVDVELLQDAPLQPLLSYFEKQWLVDIDLWNVSTTESRTNNTCEGKSETE